MSFTEKLKNRVIEIKKQAQAEFVAPDDVSAERLKLCMGCEHLYTPTNSCKKCGCFVHAKTRLAKASCPVGKW